MDRARGCSALVSRTGQLLNPCMSRRISRPHVRPIAIGLFNLLLLGAGGYMLLGQWRKAAFAAVGTGLGACACFGLCIPLVTAVDGFLLARRLAAGGEIGRDEHALALLDTLLPPPKPQQPEGL